LVLDKDSNHEHHSVTYYVQGWLQSVRTGECLHGNTAQGGVMSVGPVREGRTDLMCTAECAEGRRTGPISWDDDVQIKLGDGNMYHFTPNPTALQHCSTVNPDPNPTAGTC